MTVALIDDQLLGAVLRGKAPRALASKDLFTTGYWYVRLCQAVLGADERTGALSRPFAELPDSMRERALNAVLELPAEIGLISLRELGPTIAQWRQHHELNILSIEALAAATLLRANVYLSAASPQLEAALRSERLKVTVRSAERRR
ncbi:MAG: hypothetical protein HYX32_03590 [Actinobacteria bacterium]|nr:hypothetical protein [Actinomycetota bacterium]